MGEKVSPHESCPSREATRCVEKGCVHAKQCRHGYCERVRLGRNRMIRGGEVAPFSGLLDAGPKNACTPAMLLRSPSINADYAALSCCHRRRMARPETALTAVGGRFRIDVRTIATPRAGARTTRQTTYLLLCGAFGWV